MWKEPERIPRRTQVLKIDFDVAAPNDAPEVAASKYATRDEALAAAKQLDSTFFPATWCISSGHGLQLLWRLTGSVNRRGREGICLSCLRTTWQRRGSGADPTVTADIARVLRPPGTHNRKYRSEQPLLVTVIGRSEHVTPDAVRAKLVDFAPADYKGACIRKQYRPVAWRAGAVV